MSWGEIMKTARWIALVMILAVEASFAGTCVPFNSTVMLFDEPDAEACPAQVAAAAALGNKSINLLFTARFVVDADKKVTGYCFDTAEARCVSTSPEMLARMRGHWGKCLKAALERNMGISVYIQIDDASVHNLWRNNLVFDPLGKYGGYSYDEILTLPLAELIQTMARPDTAVEFSLQGEMGATLAHYPGSHEKLVALTKQRLAGLKNLSVGVNVNYSAVLGWGAKLSAEMRPRVQKLFDTVDFVGISAYHEVMIPIESDDFRFSHEMARDELAQLGIVFPTGKRSRISEIGMGGGNLSDDGKTPGKTLEEVAQALWSGIRGPYTAALDPFRLPAMKQFRRDFFRQLLEYLKNPPPEFNLRSAYLWNSDSWDVQGLYPATRGYQDSVVVEAIRRHNASCTQR